MQCTSLSIGGVVLGVACAASCGAAVPNTGAAIDGYVKPYVESRNFSGVVLVERNGRRAFERAYGMADRTPQFPNSEATRFHVASMSMQFTAAAILRLVDKGKLSLGEHVDAYAPRITGAEKITIRALLEERSGLPDINAQADYNDVLQQHQTPETLLTKISGRPLLFEPRTKFLHEEHSAYNLLALIVEKKTGLPFAAAVRQLVLEPAGLRNTFVDDDAEGKAAHVARGYEPEGVDGLKAGMEIRWSAKTGNGSVCTTARDEARLVRALLRGSLLSPASRAAMFDTTVDTGFGWFKRENKTVGAQAFYMNGRAPGFSSFVIYVPAQDLTVVALSNIYSSATTTMGYDIARAALGRAVEPQQMSGPIAADALKSYAGVFAFGEDFYQKNARLVMKPADGYIALEWPSGDKSSLIPAGKDRFIDRSYWQPVVVERDAAGTAVALRSGEFRGTAQRGE
jgi:CubicO group peptidase (beta-lactamase class C family)